MVNWGTAKDWEIALLGLCGVIIFFLVGLAFISGKISIPSIHYAKFMTSFPLETATILGGCKETCAYSCHAAYGMTYAFSETNSTACICGCN